MIQLLTEEDRDTLTNVERNLQEALHHLESEQFGSLRTNIANANTQLAEIVFNPGSDGDWREVRLNRKLQAAQALIREMLAVDKPQEEQNEHS